MSKASDQAPADTGSDRRDVFIYISASLGIEWTSEAYRIVTELGQVPFFYQGLESNHHGSNISDEAHADLWDCDVIVLAITPKKQSSRTGFGSTTNLK